VDNLRYCRRCQQKSFRVPGKPAGVLDAEYIGSMFRNARNLNGYPCSFDRICRGSSGRSIRSRFGLNKVTWASGAISKSPTIMCTETRGQIIPGEITLPPLMASDFDLTAPDAWYVAVKRCLVRSASGHRHDPIRTLYWGAGACARPLQRMMAIDGSRGGDIGTKGHRGGEQFESD